MKNDLLKRLELIQTTPELHAKFQIVYGSKYEMIESCIKEDLIKDDAIEFINDLTDDWLQQIAKPTSANTWANDNHLYDTASVDFILSNDMKRTVISALKTINQNPYIDKCQIDGSAVWSTVKQFNSTIDDKERKEIPKGDAFEFRSDVQQLIITKLGAVKLTAFDKWSDGTLTFEIE
tara:strand:- start:7010 stop:7543 length:534 start_codon:yes stop_codon:yes gene_type:complete